MIMDKFAIRSFVFGKNSVLLLNVLFTMAMVVFSEIFNENFVFPEEHSSHSRLYIRQVRLYNYCSKSDVRIHKDGRVNAKRPLDPHIQSKNAIFLLKNVYSHKKVAFNIIAEESKRYICFNKKNKLISRINGEKNLRCIFEEVLSFGDSENPPFYSQFRSLYNITLHIGFNHNGKPLLGSSYVNERKKKCFYFIKRNNLDFHRSHKGHGPKINVNKVIHLLRKEKLNRKRRSLPSNWNSR